jgi:hypothetical protein
MYAPTLPYGLVDHVVAAYLLAGAVLLLVVAIMPVR